MLHVLFKASLVACSPVLDEI